MPYDCAIYIEAVSEGEYVEFLEGLVEENVLKEVKPISFTDAETISIVNYDGTEFAVRHGEFIDESDARLWILFEFEFDPDESCICDAGTFELLSEKLPKLKRLRLEIEGVTSNGTGGGIYRPKKLPFPD
jgi:hypothetical protein